MTAPMWGTAFVDIEGDSAQNIVGTQVRGDVIQSMTTFVRGRPAMYLGATEVADRLNCYVPARNHDLVVKALEVDRAVVLSGPRGCGRETTAIAAIHQLHPAIAIRRFSLEDEDAEEIDTKSGCGYLIHAADGGLARLARCVEAVRDTDGYLVVIGDHDVRYPAAANLSWIAIEPPPPVQVYRRWVAARGMTEWPHWEEAAVLLEGALPDDARRLADLVWQIDRRGGDIAVRRAEVIHAYRGWEDELRRWFDEHRQPYERALLVAAAALSPAAEESCIYTTASSLAERLHITPDGRGLAWPPVTGLRALLGADQDDDKIVFRRHRYAESALWHTFADYPLARPDLLAWLAALPTDEAVPPELRDSLAATFADLAAQHGAAGQAIAAARKWGEDDLADLAFIALSRTCLHPRVGGQVRRALYDWSRGARTPQTLKLTIARVCEPLGQTYPSIALTRLKHLATHGNPQVVGEVMSAARELASGGHRAEVFTAALAWCAESNIENLSSRARQRRRRAGATLFLELAGSVTEAGMPNVLDGDQAVDPRNCAPGWQAALDFRDAMSGTADNVIEGAVWRWLDTALCDAPVRERISSAFVTAADGPRLPLSGPRAIGAAPSEFPPAKIMIRMVRRWGAIDHADPIRREIKEDIVIPLTHPQWLRLLKRLYVRLRTTTAKALRTP